jgi:heme exporter protein D
MDQLRTFLAMGGHASFVWPAFGLTAAVLVGLLVATIRRLRALQGTLARLRTPEPGAGGRARGVAP